LRGGKGGALKFPEGERKKTPLRKKKKGEGPSPLKATKKKKRKVL